MSDLKIIHTSDWHLGKKLFKYERIDEQRAFLNWLKAHIITNEVDILIVAGDIFDVPSPPVSALELLYDFIFQLGTETEVETFIITGNHDSSSLLDVPKNFFLKYRCHVYSRLDEVPNKMNYIFRKNGIRVGLKHLPYFRNHELTNIVKEEQSPSEEALENYFKSFFGYWENEKELDHKILISHHGFGKYSAAGSEHSIYLSGIDYFPLDWVNEKFDYVALGHIHKKQLLNENPPILYTGSPIPMRFSESNKKYVSEITLTKTTLDFQLIDIPIFRELLRLKTNNENYSTDLEKLINESTQQDLEKFLEVEVQMNEPTGNIPDTIRKKLEGTNIRLISYQPQIFAEMKKNNKSQINLNKLSIDDLFIKYYKIKFDSDTIPDGVLKSFQELISGIDSENT